MENIQNLINQVDVICKKNAEALDASGSRFNIFKICGVNHDENTHSAIITEFLNPNGAHGLKSNFLKSFINTFCNGDLKKNFDYESASAKTEHHTGDGRIDIFIEDGKGRVIIIENKIYDPGRVGQVEKYDSFAKNHYIERNYQLFYLTLWGNEAPNQSKKKVVYKCISHEKDIIAWLEECVCIAKQIPIVRETIIQYINHIKSLTNQDMDTENKKEIIELLSKPESLEPVFAIGENFADIKNHIVNEVFLPKLISVCKELKLEIDTKENEDWVNKPCAFQIFKRSWNFFEIRFEFRRKGLGSLIAGIVPKDGARNAKTYKVLKQHFIKGRKGNWPYNDFPIFPHWGKDAMIAIHNGKMVEIFKEEIKKILKLTKGLDM